MSKVELHFIPQLQGKDKEGKIITLSRLSPGTTVFTLTKVTESSLIERQQGEEVMRTEIQLLSPDETKKYIKSLIDDDLMSDQEGHKFLIVN